MTANRVGQVLVETYRIERLIAEGGMGSVYEASHLRLPKRFAVKFLNLNLVNNAEAQARFRREAEIIATLDHPNIVNLMDYNLTSEGVPFIVLEYLDGEHLGKRISRGKLTLAEAMRVVSPVVGALGAAHARNIVHRDLKPENIVLCRGGELVKVVDFGIAKIRDGQELTAVNMILGTIPYMAPEQLFGSAVDARTDQFGLGAILYEMLSGEMAFGGPASVPEVAARVAHHQPPFVPGVPRAVNEVLFQAMAKLADARFPTVKAFLEALIEAASRPDEPPVIVDLAEEGLPELAGEATAISIAPSAPPSTAAQQHEARASLGDDDTGSRPAATSTAERSAPAPEEKVAVVEVLSSRAAAMSKQAIASAPEDPTRQVPPTSSMATVQLDRSSLTPMPQMTAVATATAQVERSNVASVANVTNVASLSPGIDKIRETAQVSMAALETLRHPPISAVNQVPADDLTSDGVEIAGLRSSARMIWIALGIVIAVLLVAGVWLVFLRKPM